MKDRGTNRSRGFGTIKYLDETDAQIAMDVMNGAE